MTISPEGGGSYAANLDTSGADKYDTSEFELVPMDGNDVGGQDEALDGGLELVPKDDTVDSPLDGYTAEQQAADADRYSVVPKSEQGGVPSSSELFAQAEALADSERTEQLAAVENFDDLLAVLASWGDRIPHPDGHTVYLPNVINSINRYRNGEKMISNAALDGDDIIFGDITRTNGIRDKVLSLFKKQGFEYTGPDGIERSMLEVENKEGGAEVIKGEGEKSHNVEREGDAVNEAFQPSVDGQGEDVFDEKTEEMFNKALEGDRRYVDLGIPFYLKESLFVGGEVVKLGDMTPKQREMFLQTQLLLLETSHDEPGLLKYMGRAAIELKIKRTSGEVEDGWQILSVDPTSKTFIVKSGKLEKKVSVKEILEVN